MNPDAKILVTGANHLIGNALLKSLVADGKNVRAIANKNINFEEKDKIDFFNVSLFDIPKLDEVLQGIEKIYHCDEFVSFLPADEEKLYNINVIGTENLVNLALTNGVEKVVYLSSSFAFGTYQHKESISEKTRRIEHKKNTYYSICKSRSELEIIRGKAEGLKTNIVCPSIVLANTKNHRLYDFISIAQKKYHFYPEGTNGFVGLDDVVNATKKIMKSDYTDEKFILSAENHTYEKVLGMINPKLKQKNLFSRMNTSKATLISKINVFRNYVLGAKPFLTPEILNFDGKEFIFDNEKTREILNFKFTPIQKIVEDLR